MLNTHKISQELKESRIQWIGDVPKDWNMYPMRKIFTTYKEVVGQQALDYTLLRLSLNGIEPRDENSSGKNPENYDTYQLFYPDDLVMCLFDYDVTPRTVGYVREKGILTGAYTRLIPKKEVDSRYYYYLYLYLDQRKELLHLCTGLRNTLSKYVFWPLKTPYPPIESQKQIADFLGEKTAKIDQIIAKKHKLIELLKAKRISIITQAVTKGLEPKAKMKPAGVEWIGDMPKDWEVYPFKHVIHFQEGPGIMAEDFTADGVPLLRIGNIQNGKVILEGCNFLDPIKVEQKWNHFKLRREDIVISCSATTGTAAEVDNDSEGSVAYTGLIRLRPVKNKTVKDYIKYLVISQYYTEQIDLLKTGTAMQHYGPAHLRRVLVAVPSIKEQIQISEYLHNETKKIDKVVSYIYSQIDALSEYHSSLIYNAVTGKIKI